MDTGTTSLGAPDDFLDGQAGTNLRECLVRRAKNHLYRETVHELDAHGHRTLHRAVLNHRVLQPIPVIF